MIQFLLNLRDAGGNWECGKFDVIEAYAVTGSLISLSWILRPMPACRSEVRILCRRDIDIMPPQPKSNCQRNVLIKMKPYPHLVLELIDFVNVDGTVRQFE